MSASIRCSVSSTSSLPVSVWMKCEAIVAVENSEKADSDQHEKHPDDPAGDRCRIEIAVPDRRDGDDRPPDSIPVTLEVA